MAKREEKLVAVFQKAQLINSNRFSVADRDILSSVLEDNKRYSLDDVQKILDSFKKRKVK